MYTHTTLPPRRCAHLAASTSAGLSCSRRSCLNHTMALTAAELLTVSPVPAAAAALDFLPAESAEGQGQEHCQACQQNGSKRNRRHALQTVARFKCRNHRVWKVRDHQHNP